MPNLQLLLLAGICLAMAACTRRADNPDPAAARTVTTDSALYRLVKNNRFAHYLGKDTLWAPAGNSPHGAFKLRFNAKALSALDASGRLPVGGSFPDSSIVLKEFYQNGALTVLVPMLKLPRDSNAGQGWVWGEYYADGGLVHSVTNKGQGCIHCHTQAPNRDLIRSFDLH